jgi:hypothetical protein
MEIGEDFAHHAAEEEDDYSEYESGDSEDDEDEGMETEGRSSSREKVFAYLHLLPPRVGERHDGALELGEDDAAE